jgi:uncharacterized protein
MTPDKIDLHTYAGTTQLIVVQPTTLCNLNCTYCYLGHRRERNVMSEAVIRAIGSAVRDSYLMGDQVEIAFHSGEPLIVGIRWFESFLAQVTSLTLQCRPTLTYSVQTNGTLIDESWIDLLRAYRIRVGVSLDGPRRFNDSTRMNWANQSSFDRTMRGIDRLNSAGVPFALLCVLNSENLDYPAELFEFFCSLSPKLVAFNIEEVEGVNRICSLPDSLPLSRVRRFFFEYIRLAESAAFPHRVRELDFFERCISRSLRGDLVVSDTATPFRILSVSHDGALSTFCPELAEVSHPVIGSLSIGNILDGPLDQVISLPKVNRIKSDVDRGVEACRASCEYFRVCGGGSPGNKLAETGSFASTETLHCRRTIQAVADVVIARMES